MTKHTILLLEAALRDNGRSAFPEVAHAIHSELRRSSGRAGLVLETRWASEPIDLLRALRELKPTVVHFSGHGDEAGLWFPAANGAARVVSSTAIAQAFEAAGTSVRLVVLSACDSEPSAEALLSHIDCVVSISGAIDDDMIRAFVIGFYGALGEHVSIKVAYGQGNAALSLMGLSGRPRPRLWVREGVDVAQLVVVPAPSVEVAAPCLPEAQPHRVQNAENASQDPQLIASTTRELANLNEAERCLRPRPLRRRASPTSLAIAAACVALVAFAGLRQQYRDSAAPVAVSSYLASRAIGM